MLEARLRLFRFAQDVPINLAALKQRVEELKTNAEVARLQADGARPPACISHHITASH